MVADGGRRWQRALDSEICRCRDAPSRILVAGHQFVARGVAGGNQLARGAQQRIMVAQPVGMRSADSARGPRRR